MRSMFLLLLMAGSLSCLAQFKNLSVHASVNTPSIGSVSTSTEPNIFVPSAGYQAYRPEAWTLEETFKTKPGFSFGGRIDWELRKSFFLTSGLSLSYVRYQRVVEIKELNLTSVDQGNTSGVYPGTPMGSLYGSLFPTDRRAISSLSSDDMGKTTLLFAEIPVMFGKRFLKEKLTIKLGGSTSFLTYASYYRQTLYNSPSSSSTSSYYNVEKLSDKEPFNKLNFSGILETSYMIFRKVSVNVSAQKFFTPVYKDDYQYGGSAKLNLFSFGVIYQLK
jgi:hypothetical protein